MRTYTKLTSFLVVLAAVFFIHTSVASAATLITCPERPDATLNWDTTGCSTYSPSGGGVHACDFNVTSPNGFQDVANGTSCTASLSCTNAGGSASASATLEYHPELIWNGSVCVVPAACALPWGGTLASGSSATAYQASSVTSPASCTSQSRTCTNGALSGSYTNQSCIVNPVGAPTASLTIDGAHSATLTPGQVNTKSWSSTGGTSWSSSYSFSGSCVSAGTSGSWSANTESGSVTNTANGGNAGCTAVITYTVTNAAGVSASDSISVTTACSSGTAWNGSSCAVVTTPSGSIASNSCTISAGASSCAMNAVWSSSNTTGSVTVQRGYSPYGTIASGTSGNQSFTFSPPGTYLLDLYDGATKLATGSFVASCAAGSSWNGSTCYSASLTPSASISQSSSITASGESFTVSWSSSNVTSCAVTKTVNGGAPFLPFSWTSQPYPNTSGSGTASPTILGTHSFSIDCTGPNGSASNSISHTVQSTPPPPSPSCTNGYSNYPTCGPVCVSNEGQNISCSSGANSCGQTNSGTQTVQCDGSYSSCTAGNPSDPTVSASISASPNRVKIGGAITVSWTTSGANACTITKNGATWKSISSSSCSLSNSSSDTVSTQTIYGISCSNATYNASASSNLVNVVPLFQEF